MTYADDDKDSVNLDYLDPLKYGINPYWDMTRGRYSLDDLNTVARENAEYLAWWRAFPSPWIGRGPMKEVRR